MRKLSHKYGMTLVEVVVVVVIIGLLAVFLVPAITTAMEDRENARVASKWRIAVMAFEMYASETGSYPPDVNRKQIPPEMVGYFKDFDIYDDSDDDADDEWWPKTTEVGGNWDWDKDNNFAYSVSIASPNPHTIPARKFKQLERLDALIDDGDLTTGKLRKVGDRIHYIIEE